MSKQSGFLAKQAAIQQKMIDDTQRITCELMAETRRPCKLRCTRNLAGAMTGS